MYIVDLNTPINLGPKSPLFTPRLHTKHKIKPLRNQIKSPIPRIPKYRQSIPGLFISLEKRDKKPRLHSSTSNLGNTTVENSSNSISGNGVPKQSIIGKYSALHDFCMSIPYGIILLVSGLIGYFTGYGIIGIFAHIAGLVVCMTSYMSLITWRNGDESTRYTLSTSGVCLAMIILCVKALKLDVVKLPCYVMLGISSAMLLFLVYNILAGGNPPKKKKL